MAGDEEMNIFALFDQSGSCQEISAVPTLTLNTH